MNIYLKKIKIMPINAIEVVARRCTSLHIYRQVIATIAACLLSVSGGLTFGYTAVLLAQLQADDSYEYDESYDSWIASIAPLAMMLGCLYSGPIADAFGRRTSQMMIVFPFIAGWFIMGFANGPAVMLLGRFITGLFTGAVRPTTMVYIGESLDPRYRSIALFSPSMAVHVGSFISHTVGQYVYWRTSCLIFALPNLMCLIILMLLKESPLWLISKGRIDEGVRAFKLFRGESELADRELAAVLEKQNEKTEKTTFRELTNIVLSKAFMKSILTVFLLFAAVQLCGINMISFYAQDIFKKTFSGEIDAYMLMLVTDCIRIVTSSVVCMLAKIIPRKLSFLICSFSTTLILVLLVIYLYISPAGLMGLAIALMVAYIAIASALTSFSWSFVSEIFPGSVRGFGSGLSSAISFILLFISVKITPSIMANYGETVMYSSFAIVTFVASFILTFNFPETNGKSLQDIENSLYNKECNTAENNPI